MSIRAKRIIIIVCVTAAAVGLTGNVTLLISGHPGHYTVLACVIGLIGIACGLVYLRSTRGRS